MKNDLCTEEVKTTKVVEDKLILRIPSIVLGDDEYNDVIVANSMGNYFTSTHDNQTNCCNCDKTP